MKQIAIIGSGFCGTALTIQLLQQTQTPLHITLINRSNLHARGLAYGTHSVSHILNVPAERMSLFPDKPGDFYEFAKNTVHDAKPGDFLSREIYGDYLQQRLQQAIARKPKTLVFDHLNDHVLDIETTPDGVKLTLASGQTLQSHEAVIATGNFTPMTPAALETIQNDPHYIQDPWQPGVLDEIPSDARILFLGTGLTMYDMVLALQDKDHRGQFFALSRRGLTPQAHRRNFQHPVKLTIPAVFDQPLGLDELIRALRQFIADTEREGQDWREAIAAIRPITPHLWQNLSDRDKQRFLRHLQPYWDVHRHRAAPEIAQRIMAMRRQDHLHVQAGRIVSVSTENNGFDVDIRPRGGEAITREHFDYLINCTGPCTDLSKVSEPLLTTLLTRGEVQQDRLRLGLLTDDDFHLIDQNDRQQPHLYLLSPMLRAHYWESMAVPELREHAQRLAEILSSP